MGPAPHRQALSTGEEWITWAWPKHHAEVALPHQGFPQATTSIRPALQPQLHQTQGADTNIDTGRSLSLKIDLTAANILFIRTIYAVGVVHVQSLQS